MKGLLYTLPLPCAVPKTLGHQYAGTMVRLLLAPRGAVWRSRGPLRVQNRDLLDTTRDALASKRMIICMW